MIQITNVRELKPKTRYLLSTSTYGDKDYETIEELDKIFDGDITFINMLIVYSNRPKTAGQFWGISIEETQELLDGKNTDMEFTMHELSRSEHPEYYL